MTQLIAPDHTEKEFLDAIYRSLTPTFPTAVYVGLSETIMSDDGTNITEPSAADYSPQDSIGAWGFTGTNFRNTAPIDFGVTLEPWGTIRDAIIRIDNAVSGTVIFHAPLNNAKVLGTGMPMVIPVGGLEFKAAITSQYTDYAIALFLNHVFGNSAMTPPASHYAGMSNGDPGADMAGDVPPTYGEYARQLLTFTAPQAVTSTHRIDNVAEVAFGSNDIETTVSWFTIYDALTNGNGLGRIAMANGEKVISINTPIRIPPNKLGISAD